MFIKLEDFFTSKNADKSRYVVARVGCETKSNVENPVLAIGKIIIILQYMVMIQITYLHIKMGISITVNQEKKK